MKKILSLFLLISIYAVWDVSAQNRLNVLDEIEASEDFAPMFPFQPTHNAPENITNVRTWPGVDARPAGQSGFITSDGDSFVDAEGNEIRFIGLSVV